MTAPNNTAAEKRLLDFNAVLQKVGVKTRTSIYEWIQVDGFPKPIQLGQRTVRFVEAEIDRWLAQRPRAKIKVAPPGTPRRRRPGARIEAQATV